MKKLYKIIKDTGKMYKPQMSETIVLNLQNREYYNLKLIAKKSEILNINALVCYIKFYLRKNLKIN